MWGQLTIPPSKSHTLRAILFAALASGTSHIQDYLPSPDSLAMIKAVTLLGARVEINQNCLTVHGGKLSSPDEVIDCGNSGLVLRFIGAIAALLPHYTILTGDASIRNNRPVKPLLDALTQLGATAISSRGNDRAPMMIKGPITKGTATLDGSDSQPVSGLLIAGALAPHPIDLHVTNPGEKPWVDLTLDWFDRLGIKYQRTGYTHYRVEGNTQLAPFTYRVPGDFSSAAFPIAAALITNSELTLHNVDMNDAQGDKAIISILQQMGARFTVGDQFLKVEKGCKLKGIKIDINDFIDALPILSVIGCFAEGTTELYNGAMARNKESDRIFSIARELRKMGANIEERLDGVIIHHSSLHGAELESHSDHRILFSLSVAALAANGHTTIFGIECGAKTIPNFYEDFLSIGAKFERNSIRL